MATGNTEMLSIDGKDFTVRMDHLADRADCMRRLEYAEDVKSLCSDLADELEAEFRQAFEKGEEPYPDDWSSATQERLDEVIDGDRRSIYYYWMRDSVQWATCEDYWQEIGIDLSDENDPIAAIGAWAFYGDCHAEFCGWEPNFEDLLKELEEGAKC